MSETSAKGQAKKILLVVTNRSRRNLRATVFRNLGIDVVCAAHIGDARELWHPKAYDLVLFDVGANLDGSVVLCADMKAECPAQRIAWLVGQPEFLSFQPRGSAEDSTACTDNVRQLMANACEALPRRGGFLEARWRMALGRSARPTPISAHMPASLEMLPAMATPKSRDSFGDAVLKAEAEQDGAL
jgi:hypothetical protein